MGNIEKLREMIDRSSNIVFFGGAGVSTESGIPDYRSDNGLYKVKDGHGYPPEYMLSYTCFKKNTEEFFDFYKSKMLYRDAMPNAAHISLAKLEKRGKLKAIITQNIDGLHQKAGSKNVIELHGAINRNYCTECQSEYDVDYLLGTNDIPKCMKCGGIIKPDVVLYEEGLDQNIINTAIHYIEEADVLIVGGTSLVVYPAAGLLRYYGGNKLVLINKSETQYDSKAALIISDNISDVLSMVV